MTHSKMKVVPQATIDRDADGVCANSVRDSARYVGKMTVRTIHITHLN